MSIAELFSDYVEEFRTAESCIVLSLSLHRLGPVARNAIDKSLAALGYGAEANTYATLAPQDALVEGGDIPLDAQAAFMLVEGLDPLAVIATDETSARALGEAYRTTFEIDAPIRVFGRPAVAFRNLETLLETDAGKQQAWRLFKTLPKR